MRILALTSSYPMIGLETASPFLKDWAESLAARGHTVQVVAPSAHLHRAVSDEDISVATVNYLPWQSWQTLAYGSGAFENLRRNPVRLLQVPPLLWALYRSAYARSAAADVIHAHWLVPCGLVGAMLQSRTGIPLVVTVHSTDFHLLRQLPGGCAIARWIVARSARVHFVAEYLRRDFSAWLGGSPAFERKTYVAAMGVSDDLAGRAVPALAAQPTVGFIGRFLRSKGVYDLLDACAIVRPAELLLAGHGPEEQRLRRVAQDYGLRHRFLGPVAGEAKLDFFSRSDIVVFPSQLASSGRTEGMPVALLEALCLGRVVVAAAVGGIPEIVRHAENGFLFPSSDPSALSTALGHVIRQWESLRCVGHAARAMAWQLPASRVVSRHVSAYSDIVRTRRLTMEMEVEY